MARTPYADDEAEKAYQEVADQSSKVSVPGTWPEMSLGGRTGVEVSNPDLARQPSDDELEKRKQKLIKSR